MRRLCKLGFRVAVGPLDAVAADRGGAGGGSGDDGGGEAAAPQPLCRGLRWEVRCRFAVLIAAATALLLLRRCKCDASAARLLRVGKIYGSDRCLLAATDRCVRGSHSTSIRRLVTLTARTSPLVGDLTGRGGRGGAFQAAEAAFGCMGGGCETWRRASLFKHPLRARVRLQL